MSLVWDVGNVPCVSDWNLSLCVCVCVADVPSGSELCERGGGKAFQHQREGARGPKTEENWYLPPTACKSDLGTAPWWLSRCQNNGLILLLCSQFTAVQLLFFHLNRNRNRNLYLVLEGAVGVCKLTYVA